MLSVPTDHIAKVTGAQDITPHQADLVRVADAVHRRRRRSRRRSCVVGSPDGRARSSSAATPSSTPCPKQANSPSTSTYCAQTRRTGVEVGGDGRTGRRISVMWMSAMPFEVPAVGRRRDICSSVTRRRCRAIRTVVDVIPDDLPIELYLEEHDRSTTSCRSPNIRDCARTGCRAWMRYRWRRRWRESRLVQLVSVGVSGIRHAQEVRKRAKEFGFPNRRHTRRRTGRTARRWVRNAIPKPRRPRRRRPSSRNRSPNPLPRPLQEPSAVQGRMERRGRRPIDRAAQEDTHPRRYRAGDPGTPSAGAVPAAGRALSADSAGCAVVGIVEYRFLGRSACWVRDCCSNSCCNCGCIWSTPASPAICDTACSARWREYPWAGSLPETRALSESQIQDNTLALHYLVTHVVVDAVAAVITPSRC